MLVGALPPPAALVKVCQCWVPSFLVWRLLKALEGGAYGPRALRPKPWGSHFTSLGTLLLFQPGGERVLPSPGAGTTTYLHPRQQVREKRTSVIKGA